jgi:hypothetical protein
MKIIEIVTIWWTIRTSFLFPVSAHASGCKRSRALVWWTAVPAIIPAQVSTALQGFDKYGIGAYDGLPVPNLMKALSLKVRCPVPLCSVLLPPAP